jgi:hypothetical protein
MSHLLTPVRLLGEEILSYGPRANRERVSLSPRGRKASTAKIVHEDRQEYGSPCYSLPVSPRLVQSQSIVTSNDRNDRHLQERVMELERSVKEQGRSMQGLLASLSSLQQQHDRDIGSLSAQMEEIKNPSGKSVDEAHEEDGMLTILAEEIQCLRELTGSMAQQAVHGHRMAAKDTHHHAFSLLEKAQKTKLVTLQNEVADLKTQMLVMKRDMSANAWKSDQYRNPNPEHFKSQLEEIVPNLKARLNEMNQDILDITSWRESIATKLSDVDLDIAAQKTWSDRVDAKLEGLQNASQIEIATHGHHSSRCDLRSEITCLHQQIAETTQCTESLSSKVDVHVHLITEQMGSVKEALAECKQTLGAHQSGELDHVAEFKQLQHSFDTQFTSLQKQIEQLQKCASSQQLSTLMEKARQVASNSELKTADALKDELKEQQSKVVQSLRCLHSDKLPHGENRMSHMLQNIKDVASPARSLRAGMSDTSVTPSAERNSTGGHRRLTRSSSRTKLVAFA